ncbi:MAG: glycosyltransferase family 2 protein [Acidobacteria bacterium]|nr:glycosyltransferase family 2 protein [Acidobacteriota bacterium]
MGLSVIIPTYNEAATIETIVERVRSTPFDKEIIIVDDGSTDGTLDKLDRLERDDDIRVVRHERNRGKGAALRSGFPLARQDIVLVQDADLEYAPRDSRQLVEPILEGRADVVYGSRFVGGHSHRMLYFWHAVGNRCVTFLSNLFTNLNLTDMETGYKVFRREVIQQIRIEEDRFGFEPEITAKLVKLRGIRVYEVGVSYAGRTFEDGKKIDWRDGLHAVWCIVKYNLFR